MLRYSKGVRYPRAKISHIKLGASKDWIVLDLKMPGMSGQQLYYRMAESDQKLARRVIFRTGDTASPDTRDFISASGNPVVSKPFSVDELHRQILKSLDATNGSRDGGETTHPSTVLRTSLNPPPRLS